MPYFNFHHHQASSSSGIYSLDIRETALERMFSAGIHPACSGSVTPEMWLHLEDLCRMPHCVAIGECGLDSLVRVDIQLQKEVFLRQIDLANRLQKPLIIHCVRCFSELIAFKKKMKVAAVVHGFNKKTTVGKELLKHDFYLSVGKSVLHNVNLQQFVKDCPLDRLFLETDGEDFGIECLYIKTAELKGVTVGELIQQIQRNLKDINIFI